MNKRQIADAALCEKTLGDKYEYKDCSSCSCQVCIADIPKVFTPNDYQVAALRTANKDSKDLILNGVLGLCGETGEVSDIVKKHLFQGHELDRQKAIEELGDVCWYLAITAHGLGIDLESVMEININKLKKRYPDGFDADKSINREV